jgi:hypothetical protein
MCSVVEIECSEVKKPYRPGRASGRTQRIGGRVDPGLEPQFDRPSRLADETG